MMDLEINYTKTNLAGSIKTSQEAKGSVDDFFLELEAVMTKYKVTKVDVAFDVFKMMKQKTLSQ